MRKRRLNSGYSGNTDQRRTKAGTIPAMKHYMERCDGEFFGFNLWTPSQIDTQLWLDAADPSSVVLVSNTVSQWSDKSGKSKHVTQTTANSRPLYGSSFLNGKNTILFDGVDDSFELGDGNPTFGTTDLDAVNTEQFSVFAIAKATTGSPNGSQGTAATILCKSGGYANAATFTLGRGFVGTDSVAIDRFIMIFRGYTLISGTAGTQTAPNFIEPANSDWNIHNSNWNGSNLSHYYNTTLMPSISTVGPGANQNSIFRIGVAGATSATGGYLGGEIAEIIILDTAISTENRQKVEGYLAYKWGQNSLLPADHPYKEYPPFI